MRSTQRSGRRWALVLSTAVMVVSVTGCSQDPPPKPDPAASATKLKPASTACRIFPTDLATTAMSKFRGGLTETYVYRSRKGSVFSCTIDVFEDGLRFRAITVRLTVHDADFDFSAIRTSLRTAPYLTLPPTLGEGYARDNHVGLLRLCRPADDARDRNYLIGIGVEKDTGVIDRTHLAKVITDAVPFLDKHMGCAPALAK